jgi:hypothetical protein
MVKAILNGSKTQTRRVIKRPRYRHEIDHEGVWLEDEYGDWDKAPCPYGQPGDRLWVRETWADNVCTYPNPKALYRADAIQDDSGEREDCWWIGDTPFRIPRWTPSIHMPRWASRITLEITGVRVERLQEISDQDARAEGVEVLQGPFDVRERRMGIYGHAFAHLWDSLAKPGADWAANPWVWVIEFKKL